MYDVTGELIAPQTAIQKEELSLKTYRILILRAIHISFT